MAGKLLTNEEIELYKTLIQSFEHEGNFAAFRPIYSGFHHTIKRELLGVINDRMKELKMNMVWY